jgi:DNA-binding CsgD family transcriptional regulator/tetratricopeptide (TPR) repeat protein
VPSIGGRSDPGQPHSMPPTAPANGATMLRGREAQLGRLARLLDPVQTGAGGWLLMEGAAGTGKSALVNAFCAQARARNVTVAAVEADEVDSATPLGTLVRALAMGSRPILEADNVDRIRQNAARGFWAIRNLQAALTMAAVSGPLAIVIDDACWADDTSLQAVHALVRDVVDRPISWLLASRPDPRPAYERLRRLAGDDASHLLRLEHLGEVHRVQIMRDLLGAEPDGDVIALLRGTEHNLVDLVDTLVGGVQSGAFVIDGGQARLSAQVGVDQFRHAVASALARLSSSARRMIDIAAVLGRSFRIADLGALLDTPVPHLVTELRELLTENLVVDGGAALTFRHDLIRLFVLEALPSTVCGALNRDVALHLLAAGTPAGDVAPYVFAGTTLDDSGSGPLVDTAEQIITDAAGRAPSVYRRALDFAATGSRQWVALAAPTARALAYGGRLSEAEALISTALERDLEVTDEAEIRLALAEACWLRGYGAHQNGALERVLRHPGVSGELSGRVWAALRSPFSSAGRPADALSAADEAIVAARPLRDHSALTAALLAGSIALRSLGRMDQSLSYAAESASVARRIPGVRAREPRIWMARTLNVIDRLDDAEGYCEDVLRDIHVHGNVSMLPAAHATRAQTLLARGRIADAAAEAEAGMAAADSTETSQMSTELAAILALLQVFLGNNDLACQSLHKCEDLVRSGLAETDYLPLARAANATDAQAAMAACADVIDGLQLEFGPLVLDPVVGPFLARIALAAGDFPRARAVAEASVRLAELNPCVLGWSAAQLHVEGLVTGNAARMREASRAFTRVGRHLVAAIALADASLPLVQEGQRTAVASHDEATAALTAMGAVGIVTMLRDGHPAGGPRSRRRCDRPQSGWESLTSAELRVLMIAATGESNKEIARQLWLSPHTVDTHIRHILEKLGLRSRVAMAREAGERGIIPADSRPHRVASAPGDSWRPSLRVCA